MQPRKATTPAESAPQLLSSPKRNVFQRACACVAASAVCLVAHAETTTSDEIASLRAQLAAANQAIALQQQALDQLQQRLDALEGAAAQQPPLASSAVNIAATTPQPENPLSNLKLYGYVKLDASYDTDATNSGNLAMWVQPHGAVASDDEFNITAKQSRLGLLFQGNDFSGLDSAARLEMDFYGSASETAPSPRLRRAYVTVRNEKWELLAGQEWDTTSIQLPTTVNFATLGNTGALWSRRPQVRLSRFDQQSYGTYTSAVAIARTVGSDLDGMGQEDGKDSAFPTVQAKFGYSGQIGDRDIALGIAGHYGTQSVDFGADDGLSLQTHSLSLQGSYELTNSMKLTSVLWSGSNLSDYHGGIAQGINPVTFEEIDARGGWLQLSHQTNDNLKLALTYGIDDPDDADLQPGNRSRNQTASIASFLSFSEHLTWATELSYMKTEYLQQEANDNVRLQNAILYKF